VKHRTCLPATNRSDGSGTTYIFSNSRALVYAHQPNQATGQPLVSMLDRLTHEGQVYAADTGYVPLRPQIEQLALTTLQQVTGPTGAHFPG